MTGKQLPMAASSPAPAPKRRLPEWFRTSLPSGAQQAVFNSTKAAVKDNMLHTVCEEARCPNIHECWASGDATFMIAGQECTRGCRFCAVGTIKRPPPLDPEEPSHLAQAVASMNLRHAVITVVNRDDLPTAAPTTTSSASTPSLKPAQKSPSNCSVPTSQATSTLWPICSSKVLCQCLLTMSNASLALTLRSGMHGLPSPSRFPSSGKPRNSDPTSSRNPR